MGKTPVILVGGFLGAGKTTLIAAATNILNARGKRVGIVTNDQAANLVDTAALLRPGLPIQEVSGGCFCCRFDDLVTAMDRLVEMQTPDILIGEPVGSCTDLSATVIQPMKQLLADRFGLTPFSIVVDATQLRSVLQGGEMGRFPENVLYIYRKQLEEADLILLNKSDLLGGDELVRLTDLLKQQFPQALVMPVSAFKGHGVNGWLDYVLKTPGSGRTITEVDYDIYAEGEAALGWLNAAVQVQSEQKIDWQVFCRDFMEAMRSRLQHSAAEIAHLKLHLTVGDDAIAANLTNNNEDVSIRGELGDSQLEARLLVNVRANTAPDQLQSITEECLKAVSGETIRLTAEEIDSFAPARPEPTHRFGSVS